MATDAGILVVPEVMAVMVPSEVSAGQEDALAVLHQVVAAHAEPPALRTCVTTWETRGRRYIASPPLVQMVTRSISKGALNTIRKVSDWFKMIYWLQIKTTRTVSLLLDVDSHQLLLNN